MTNTEEPKEQMEVSAPQKMTPVQNAILTIKVLVGAGLLVALFWMLDGAIS